MDHGWTSIPTTLCAGLVVPELEIVEISVPDLSFAACAEICRMLFVNTLDSYRCSVTPIWVCVHVLITGVGRDLPNLAKISWASGLVISGGSNKNDSYLHGREWRQTVGSFCQAERPFWPYAMPGLVLWTKCFPCLQQGSWLPIRTALSLGMLLLMTLHSVPCL